MSKYEVVSPVKPVVFPSLWQIGQTKWFMLDAHSGVKVASQRGIAIGWVTSFNTAVTEKRNAKQLPSGTTFTFTQE